MKYTVILIALLVAFYVWRFSSAVAERGLPDSPIYYVASAGGIALAFTYKRLTKEPGTLKSKILNATYFIVIAVSFGLGFSGIYSLKLIGSGIFFWSLVASLGLFGFDKLRTVRLKKPLTELENDQEYASRGMVLMILFLLLALSPIIIFVIFLAIVTSN